MKNVYKHESGYSVELLAIANSTADDGRAIVAVYRVLKTNEVFTSDVKEFDKEFTALETLEDLQLKDIDFIA